MYNKNNSKMIYRNIILLAIISLNFIFSESARVEVSPSSCTVSQFEDIAQATTDCDVLTITDLVIPKETTMVINLKDGAKLVFAGHITHEVAEWAGDLIQVYGKNVEISGTDTHLLDGLGPQHWKGSDEKDILRPKMIRFQLQNSSIKDLKLKNCACNCFMITKCENVIVSNIDINNYDGYPGVAGKNFAKNTDGFDVTQTTGLRIENSSVVNQDDCVVVNSGSNMWFENIYCNGSHGLSFSVFRGDASDITFANSLVEHAGIAIHIKTHHNAETDKGFIRNVLYKDIRFNDISNYAISVQENYGSNEAVGNIPITNLTLDNVKGTMSGERSVAYQIICGKGGCEDWHFKDVEVKGAAKPNECLEVPSDIKC